MLLLELKQISSLKFEDSIRFSRWLAKFRLGNARVEADKPW